MGRSFFLFEKLRAPDARFQDYMTQVYNDFKIRNGYKIDQIYKKTESIRGVLEPFLKKAILTYLKEQDSKISQQFIIIFVLEDGF